MTDESKVVARPFPMNRNSITDATKASTLLVDVQPQKSVVKEMKVDTCIARETATSIFAWVGDLETSRLESSTRSKHRHSQSGKRNRPPKKTVNKTNSSIFSDSPSSSSSYSSSLHKEASDQCSPNYIPGGEHASIRRLRGGCKFHCCIVAER